MLRFQIDHRVLNGPVLGIMNDAMHGPENLCSVPVQNQSSVHTRREPKPMLSHSNAF